MGSGILTKRGNCGLSEWSCEKQAPDKSVCGGYNLDTEVSISMDSLFSEIPTGKILVTL